MSLADSTSFFRIDTALELSISRKGVLLFVSTWPRPKNSSKGGKAQYIPLNPEALACIKEEVKFRTETFGKKPAADEPLFTNRYGRRYRKIRGSLKTACRKAEVPYVTHHSLRHFFANMLKEQTLDIGEISRFLGHANPTVTQNIYLHWRDEALHGRAQEVQILRPRIQKWQKSAKSSK